jgi:hypothetical protein
MKSDMCQSVNHKGDPILQWEQEHLRSEGHQAERSGEDITRWIGPYPHRKVADGDVVNDPKIVVKITHQGKS